MEKHPLGGGSDHESIEDKLKALTVEHVMVLDMLSRDVHRGTIATDRGAKLAEIHDLIETTRSEFGLEIHGLVYLLLSNHIIELDAKEKAAATAKLAELSPREQELVSKLMTGCSYQQAAKLLNRQEGTVKAHATQINKKLGTHSLPAIARLGFAGGLSGAEFETLADEADTPISRQNIRLFLGWMYLNQPLPELDSMFDDDLRALSQTIVKDAKKYGSSQGRRVADHMRTAITAAESLMQGQSVAKIAEEQGRTDGSVLIGLTNLADKLGKLQYLDELVEKAEASNKSNDSAKQVIQTIHAKLVGEKALMLDSFVYETPFGLTPNFEAELVTLINLSGQPIHANEIIRQVFGERQLTVEQNEEIETNLRHLVEDGSIIDEGSGFYSQRPWLPQPEPAAEPRQRPPEQSGYPSEYRRTYQPGPNNGSKLDDMISSAGLVNSVKQARRVRPKPKGR